jgi:hypothetical protein
MYVEMRCWFKYLGVANIGGVSIGTIERFFSFLALMSLPTLVPLPERSDSWWTGVHWPGTAMPMSGESFACTSIVSS